SRTAIWTSEVTGEGMALDGWPRLSGSSRALPAVVVDRPAEKPDHRGDDDRTARGQRRGDDAAPFHEVEQERHAMRVAIRRRRALMQRKATRTPKRSGHQLSGSTR